MSLFSEIVSLSEQRYVGRVSSIIRHSRILPPRDVLVYLEILDLTALTGNDDPDTAEIGTTDLARRCGVSRQQLTKIEGRLRGYGLMERAGPRSSTIYLPRHLQLTLGQIIALWPRHLQNRNLWDRVLDTMSAHEMTQPFVPTFEDPDGRPWFDPSTQKCVYIDANMRLCEPLKSVLMPLDTMPLHSEEENPQYTIHSRDVPGGPPREPQEDLMDQSNRPMSDKVKALGQSLQNSVGEARAKQNQRKQGRPVTRYKKPEKPTTQPAEVNFNRIDRWAGDWVRYLDIISKNHNVPLWCHDDVIAKTNKDRESAGLQAVEIVGRGDLTRPSKAVRLVAAQAAVRKQMHILATKLFGSATKETLTQLAAFFSESLFPNWQYYRTQVLRKPLDELFAFHPKYLAAAADTLIPLVDQWQSSLTSKTSTAPTEIDEDLAAYTRRKKEQQQKP